MLRRSILQLSSGKSIHTTQIPAFLSARKEFSNVSQNNAPPKPQPSAKPPESNGRSSSTSKFVLGSAVVAGAILVAHQTGYLDPYFGKTQQQLFDGPNDQVANDFQEIVVDPSIAPTSEEPQGLDSSVDHPHKFVTPIDLPPVETEQKVDTHTDVPHSENWNESKAESPSPVQEKSEVHHDENNVPIIRQENLPEYSKNNVPSGAQTRDSGIPAYGNLESGSQDSKTSTGPDELAPTTSTHTLVSAVGEERDTLPKPPLVLPEDKPEVAAGDDEEAPSSLLGTYHLIDERTPASFNTLANADNNHLLKETEAFVNAIEEIKMHDGYISKEGKLVFDFLQAIHAAEKRQAEEDARAFAEEKRELKEKYESELRDLRARELMRIEEVEILDKELKREHTRTVVAIKSLQEKMEEKLHTELEQKETEAEMKLRKAQELAKAEFAAAIACEKAAQNEKIAEANLHINALCMAFYARSEEARKSHSVHKLTLGALALEDSLSKGLPIQKELDALDTHLEGIGKDAALDLVLSSLPEETRYNGTDTLLQLNQKFNAFKGTLRHFGLIPLGGGGILTHSLAHLASWLKLKNVDESGDGIESVIGRVENYLAQGKLTEAADALEQGVKGSQAEEIVSEWVKRARNRAITEQALTLLESYATCLSLT